MLYQSDVGGQKWLVGRTIHKNAITRDRTKKKSSFWESDHRMKMINRRKGNGGQREDQIKIGGGGASKTIGDTTTESRGNKTGKRKKILTRGCWERLKPWSKPVVTGLHSGKKPPGQDSSRDQGTKGVARKRAINHAAISENMAASGNKGRQQERGKMVGWRLPAQKREQKKHARQGRIQRKKSGKPEAVGTFQKQNDAAREPEGEHHKHRPKKEYKDLATALNQRREQAQGKGAEETWGEAGGPPIFPEKRPSTQVNQIETAP